MFTHTRLTQWPINELIFVIEHTLNQTSILPTLFFILGTSSHRSSIRMVMFDRSFIVTLRLGGTIVIKVCKTLIPKKKLQTENATKQPLFLRDEAKKNLLLIYFLLSVRPVRAGRKEKDTWKMESKWRGKGGVFPQFLFYNLTTIHDMDRKTSAVRWLCVSYCYSDICGPCWQWWCVVWL